MKTHFSHAPLLCLYLICIIFSLLLASAPAQAQEVSGNISEDTTWGSGETTIVGDVIVDAGVTLTVEAGATIKFDGDYSLTVNGQLVAEGTSASRITFTSAQTSPSSGDWGSITFTADAFPSSSLRHVTIRYAGTAISADGLQAPEALSLEGVQIYDVSGNGMSVTNSVVEMVAASDGTAPVIEDFGSTGVFVTGRSSEVTVTGTEIRQSGARVRSGSGLWAQNGAALTITGSTVERCGVGLDVSHRRDNNDAPQTVTATGNVITENGTGVRVNPGDASGFSYFEEEEYPELTVTGNAITSNVDWEVAIYRGQAARTTELDLTENWWGTRDGVAIAERIRDQSDDGKAAFADFIPFLDAAPDAGGSPTDQDESGNTYRAGRIDADEQWLPSDNIVITGETVMEGQLTLEAGTTVRAQSNRLTVLGALTSNATEASPVTFTSNRGTPAPGDWGGVVLDGAAINGAIDYWRVRYASTGLTLRNVQPSTPAPVAALEVSDAQSDAVLLDNARATGSDWLITQSGGGVRAQSSSQFALAGGAVQDISGTAVSVENAVIDGLDSVVIEDFGSAGIYATGRSAEVTVTGAAIRQSGARVRSGSGLWVQNGAALTLTESTVERCGVGLDVRNTEIGDYPQLVSASGNVIEENGSGVRVRPDVYNPRDSRGERYPSVFEVTGNVIAGNVNWDTEVRDGLDARQTELNLRENWWGTRDGVAIAERIRDQSDDGKAAFADFIPFLDAAPDAGGSPTDQDESGNTYRAGRIDTYSSWPQADNPHIVVGSVLVGAAGNLTVEGGSLVRILKNQIEVEGGIFLNGTDQNRIELRPYDSGTPWSGLSLSPPLQDAQIRYVTIRGATEGINVSNVQPSDPSRMPVLEGLKIYDTATGITVASSQVEVRRSEIVGFDNTGVSVTGGASFLRVRDRTTVGQTGTRTGTGTCLSVSGGPTVTVQTSVIASCLRGVNVYHNGGSPPPPIEITGSVVARHDVGFRIDPNDDSDAYPVVIANSNDIKNNNSFNVRVEQGKNPASTTLDFTGNWWGTEDSTAIASTIRDRQDSGQLATVEFRPFSTEATGTYGLADINTDGRTDGFDLSLLAAAFGTQEGEPNYNPSANLYSNDTRIDGFDLAILGTRFGDLGATNLKRLAPLRAPGESIEGHNTWVLPTARVGENSTRDTTDTNAEPTIRVLSQTDAVAYAPGDTVRYSLLVEETPPLFAARSVLNYDTARLAFAGGEVGELLQRDGVSVLGIARSNDGTVHLGLTRTQDGRWSSPKGGGRLATVIFVARTEMESAPTLSIKSVGLLGPDARTPYQSAIESTDSTEPNMRARTGIEAVYPNPVRSRARMEFSVQESSLVHIALYNVLGQRVRVLTDKRYERGRHAIDMPVAELPTGAYFVRMKSPDGASAAKFVVVR